MIEWSALLLGAAIGEAVGQKIDEGRLISGVERQWLDALG